MIVLSSGKIISLIIALGVLVPLTRLFIFLFIFL